MNEAVWGDTRVLGDEFGGAVNSFIASNAAVSRSPNEGHMAVGVGGLRLSCMWICWTRGCEELTSWIARRAASESEVIRKFRGWEGGGRFMRSIKQ